MDTVSESHRHCHGCNACSLRGTVLQYDLDSGAYGAWLCRECTATVQAEAQVDLAATYGKGA